MSTPCQIKCTEVNKDREDLKNIINLVDLIYQTVYPGIEIASFQVFLEHSQQLAIF